jgi:hypothetical protein
VSASKTKSTTSEGLDPKTKFFHVINDHRWLAASGCTWNFIRTTPSESEERKHLDNLLPNIDVMIQASLLSHARSLIDFYTKKRNGRDADIVVEDFVPGARSDDHDLKNHKKSIELHLLHLTNYRDDQFRSQNPTAKNLSTARADWNSESPLIVDKLHGCLKSIADRSGNWQAPFRMLYTASAALYRDKPYPWPTDLGEKPDVEEYLKSLGL